MAILRVAHVITKLEFGGAQQNTLYTLTHLDPSRFEAFLVTGPGGMLDAQAAASNRLVVTVPHLVREIHPVKDALALWELFRVFRQQKPDIVHTHSSKAGILGRIAARLALVPIVVHTYHGFGFTPAQSPLTRWVYLFAERFCARLSDRLVFVSKANRLEAVRLGLGVPERHDLIRSGVKLSDFPAKVEDPGALKASIGLGMHKPMILSVGNLKPQKNPEDFVRMAAAVVKGYPEARFCYVGDGPLKTKVQAALVREKLHSQVAFVGWRKDTAERMAAADVFVLTSLWEGLPRALVEAMKSGLASACYATDGVKDVVRDGDNGFLVPPGDWQGLAVKVAKLLREPELRKAFGQKAAASIGDEFDIDVMVKKQEGMYMVLAGQAIPYRPT